MMDTVGIDNSGNIVAKNRAYRRRHRTIAQLENKSKKFYTTSQVRKRKRNGKTTKIRKKSR